MKEEKVSLTFLLSFLAASFLSSDFLLPSFSLSLFTYLFTPLHNIYFTQHPFQALSSVLASQDKG